MTSGHTPTTTDRDLSQFSYEDLLRNTRVKILDRTLLIIALLSLAALLLGVVGSLQSFLSPGDFASPVTLDILVRAGLTTSFFWFLLLGKRFLPFGVRALGLIAAIYANGISESFGSGLIGGVALNLLAIVIWAAIFYGLRGGLIATAVSTITSGVLGLLLQQGLIVPEATALLSIVDGSAWLSSAVRFSILTPVLITGSFRLIRSSEEAINRQQVLTKNLETERQNLEGRIDERTRALRLTADVSRTLVMILDKDQLVLEVVDQIQRAFNYYHVHIYLLDRDEKQLLMAGGTGEAGKALLIGKHKLPVGQGLVGRAALMGIPILVGDVSKDKYWLPNPLLPETRSEIAVPILHEDKVLGVLDVQDNTANSLDETDVDLLETIGNQLGVAIANADLYQRQTERALRQAQLNEIGKKIQFAPDVEATVQVAVREIGQSLRVNRTSVLLHAPTDKTAPEPQLETNA
jgi:putative methionine-R-sulfoxide reductase with GAF domain